MRITSAPTYANRRPFGLVDLFEDKESGMDLLSDEETGVDLTEQSDAEETVTQPDAPAPVKAWYQQRNNQIIIGSVAVLALVLTGVAVASQKD